MSTESQTTRCQDIPATRRVIIHDAAQMPQEYSATPGGTLFSTTPGGTRIIYDRKFLLQCRTSPLARTPPKLPDIPGVTSQLKHDLSADHPTQISNSIANHSSLADESAGEDAQFDMDI